MILSFIWSVASSCAGCAEVEFLFQTVHRKETVIYWSLTGCVHNGPLLADLDFLHVSKDKSTAYFKMTIDAVVKKTGRASSRSFDPLDPRSFRDFECETLNYHINSTTTRPTGRCGKSDHVTPVTRTGFGPNTAYMTDMELFLPQFHRDIEQVYFDWKAFFASISNEEHHTSVTKVARFITNPSVFRLSTEYPIVTSADTLRYC